MRAAVGETGDTGVDAVVNASDYQAVAGNLRCGENPASVAFAYDINRDRLVDSADLQIVESHFTTPETALRLAHGFLESLEHQR